MIYAFDHLDRMGGDHETIHWRRESDSSGAATGVLGRLRLAARQA